MFLLSCKEDCSDISPERDCERENKREGDIEIQIVRYRDRNREIYRQTDGERPVLFVWASVGTQCTYVYIRDCLGNSSYASQDNNCCQFTGFEGQFVQTLFLDVL